jgi:O-antigen/teichoic acid export membrane protein
LFRGSSIALVMRVLSTAASYLFNFIIARQLGASAVGAFALATTVVLILGMVSRLGLDRAVVKFVAANIATGSRAAAAAHYWRSILIVLTLAGMLSVALYFSADWLATSVFQKPHLADVFRIIAPAVLSLSLLLVAAEGIRGTKRIGEFAFFRHLAVYLLATPLLLLTIQDSPNAEAAVTAFLAASVIAAIAALVRSVAALPIKSPIQIGGMSAMLAVALPMFMSNSMGMVISWTDVLMLGRFVSDTEVGVYSIAFKLAFATGLLLNAVNSISTPKFAELHAAGDNTALADLMRETTRLLFITAIPILIVLVVGGKFLLGIFGAEFTSGYTALVILIAGQFVSTISGPVGNLLQMTGNERAFLYIVACMASLNVILNLLLIPRYGIVGAAISSAVTLTLNNVLCVVTIRKRLGFTSIFVPYRNTEK